MTPFAEVTVSNPKFDMTALVSGLLNPDAPSDTLPELRAATSAQPTSDTPDSGPALSPTPERRPVPWRTLRTPEGTRPSPRQQMRDARNWAEAWYQAIREWKTRTSAEVVPRTHLGSGGAGRMTVIVGNYGRGQATLQFSHVWTPLGWLSESAVAQAVSRQGGLDRVRAGTSLSSLIDPCGGWHQEKMRALTYAVAVLAVASDLGDDDANTHSPNLNFPKD